MEVVFFPFMAHGHIIPFLDMARLFASRGVKATFITTPANAPVLSESDNINLEIIPFPSEEVGLPIGLESIDKPLPMELRIMFIEALKLMSSGPLLKKLLVERRPMCLVADMFLPWTAEVASKAGIPWVAFYAGSYFSLSVLDFLRRKNSQWEVESEDDEFVLPEFPTGEVKFSRRILPPLWRVKDEEKTTPFLKFHDFAFEIATNNSFGVIVNTFRQLEDDYADHYQMAKGTRCWSLGPLSLGCRNIEDKARRGKQANMECLRWLDSKPQNSVIYVSFGSVVNLSSTHLIEIAKALESSKQHFIWVLSRPNYENNKEDNEVLTGFEARNQGKGLIIRGWAPQVMILDHKATGGFMTHCGWNSTLEGVSSGVPMVTWPANFYDHSLNEKLITEILSVGVSVGANQTSDWMNPLANIGCEAIEAAVRRVMVGEEAEEMRRRAAELKKMASETIQQEGSSYNDLTDLLNTLTSLDVNCGPRC